MKPTSFVIQSSRPSCVWGCSENQTTRMEFCCDQNLVCLTAHVCFCYIAHVRYQKSTTKYRDKPPAWSPLAVTKTPPKTPHDKQFTVVASNPRQSLGLIPPKTSPPACRTSPVVPIMHCAVRVYVSHQGEPVRYVRDRRGGVPDVSDTMGLGGVFSEDCSRGRGALRLLPGGKARRTGEGFRQQQSHILCPRLRGEWWGPGDLECADDS